MELSEFVTETLMAIQRGVFEAINRMEKEKIAGVISPVWHSGEQIDWKDYAQPVEFDVVVTTADKASATGKAGIKVLSFVEAGGEGTKGREHSTVNRIKFSVLIVPPLKSARRYDEVPKESP